MVLSVAVDKYVISTLAKCKFLRAGPALAQGSSSLQRTCRRAKCILCWGLEAASR